MFKNIFGRVNIDSPAFTVAEKLIERSGFYKHELEISLGFAINVVYKKYLMEETITGF